MGNEVVDNMCKGETSCHDYDAFDEMNNEADKLKTPFADKDVMGGWKNFGVMGPEGATLGIQGLPHHFASSRVSHTILHVISFQNAPL